MKKLWLLGILLALVLALAACGGSGAAGPTKGTWDNSKWDSAIWQ